MASEPNLTAPQRALIAAERYAERGWAPIALRSKIPLAKGWTSSTPEDWRALWVAGARNVGICTGPNSGVVVVDIDVKDGGVRHWETLMAEHGEPRTVVVATGGGGYHYYFAYDHRAATLTKGIKRIRNSKGVPVGIDLMTKGSQVVAPPSVHDSGRRYEFVVPPEVVGELPPMPDWLYDLLRATE